MADHPLRPANHRSLGRPLPHQLANGTRAPLRTTTFMKRSSFIPKAKAKGTISGISPVFTGLFQIQRQVTHALLTRAPLYSFHRSGNFSFDLHVLGTPPAFILSQDQTLHLNLSKGLIPLFYTLLNNLKDLKRHHYLVFKEQELVTNLSSA